MTHTDIAYALQLVHLVHQFIYSVGGEESSCRDSLYSTPFPAAVFVTLNKALDGHLDNDLYGHLDSDPFIAWAQSGSVHGGAFHNYLSRLQLLLNNDGGLMATFIRSDTQSSGTARRCRCQTTAASSSAWRS